jgi:short-subunit dehydrogenase
VLLLSLALKPAVDRATRIVNPAYVRTPLLQENLDSPGFDHFVIEPETVADAVVKQLHSGNGGHVILPARYTIACALRAFPSWMQELVRNGVNQGMFAIHGFLVALTTVFCSHLLRLLI